MFQLGIQAAVNSGYDGGNQGVDEEAGIFLTGVLWLLVGIFFAAAGRTVATPEPVPERP